MGARPVLFDVNTRVLTKNRPKGRLQWFNGTPQCIIVMIWNELPNFAAYAYQDVHVWSAFVTCLPPPPTLSSNITPTPTSRSVYPKLNCVYPL